MLRRAGHAAQTVRDMQLDTAADTEILQIAGRAGLIVLTADEDFARLHAVSQIEHAGILLIPQPNQQEAAAIVHEIVSRLDAGYPGRGELHRLTPEAGWLLE